MVGVDLTRLDEISIDLAVLLCLASRMLRVRHIRLVVGLRNGTEAPQGAHRMLERLHVWRVDDDRLADISRAAAHARLGEHGWQPLSERTCPATIVKPASTVR